MKLLKDKKILIMGIANSNSIAWSIAKHAYEMGAKLAFTYQGEILKKRAIPLAEEVEAMLFECDVTDSSSIEKLFADLSQKWGNLDGIVHSIAFADKNELKGRYIDTSLNNFLNSMHISCYSLTEIAKHAEPIMNTEASIVTLTYYGADKVIPNYNVMGVAKAALQASVKYLASDMGEKGIRVNAISAGPIKTLAASAIGGFRDMLAHHESVSALKRNCSTSDVAKSAVYLLSNLSTGVTGENHFVDCGYSIKGM